MPPSRARQWAAADKFNFRRPRGLVPTDATRAVASPFVLWKDCSCIGLNEKQGTKRAIVWIDDAHRATQGEVAFFFYEKKVKE